MVKLDELKQYGSHKTLGFEGVYLDEGENLTSIVVGLAKESGVHIEHIES